MATFCHQKRFLMAKGCQQKRLTSEKAFDSRQQHFAIRNLFWWQRLPLATFTIWKAYQWQPLLLETFSNGKGFQWQPLPLEKVFDGKRLPQKPFLTITFFVGNLLPSETFFDGKRLPSEKADGCFTFCDKVTRNQEYVQYLVESTKFGTIHRLHNKSSW